jgi:hypothetical protein
MPHLRIAIPDENPAAQPSVFISAGSIGVHLWSVLTTPRAAHIVNLQSVDVLLALT